VTLVPRDLPEVSPTLAGFGSLESFGMLMMVFEVLRLVLCRFGDGSGVLLLGTSDNLTISLL
jgi:hypothetical protein